MVTLEVECVIFLANLHIFQACELLYFTKHSFLFKTADNRLRTGTGILYFFRLILLRRHFLPNSPLFLRLCGTKLFLDGCQGFQEAQAGSPITAVQIYAVAILLCQITYIKAPQANLL